MRRPSMRLIVPALGAAAACAALAVLPATTASASPAHFAGAPNALTPGLAAAHYGGHLGGAAQASTAAAKKGFNINGYNWSGAAATGSGFTSVSSSWTEPSVTCNSTNDLMAPWVGIDGYGSSTVEQTGVATDCSSGHAVYQAWYEMYPANPVYYTNSVSAGDKFNASVTRSGTSYTLTISDTTKGWTKTTTKSLNASNASAEVIIESPTGAYPKFGTVNFTNSKINGSNLSNYNPTLMDASNGSGYEDHTSAVSGGSFSISYLHE
ncbi:MAG TPA: G1 family glutamic endopeptidase [Jatrophihabitans sp.]|nr:G1 family glutamic endopeptidase [Jatrophihabitans sp.]